jgi:hypothetical protein
MATTISPEIIEWLTEQVELDLPHGTRGSSIEVAISGRRYLISVLEIEG